MAENLIRDTIQAVTFSSDTQVADVTQELVRLLENGWKIDANSSGIEKVYHFEKSRRRIFFDAIVNEISGFKQHHPTLTSTPFKSHVHWTTHQPAGLSWKDIHMAHLCDSKAKEIASYEKL